MRFRMVFLLLKKGIPMNKLTKYSFFLPILMLMIPNHAFGTILAANPQTLTLSAKNSSKDVRVSNLSKKSKAYVYTSAAHKTKDGRFLKVDSGSGLRKLGLLLSPKKFMLRKKGSRTVRINALKFPENKEKSVLIYFDPKVGKMRKSKSKDLEKDQKNAGVVVLIGAATRVTLLPKNVVFNPLYKRSKHNLYLENLGNTTVLFFGLKQCPENICEKLSAQKLHPGKKRTIILPYDIPVSMIIKDKADNEKKVVV